MDLFPAGLTRAADQQDLPYDVAEVLLYTVSATQTRTIKDWIELNAISDGSANAISVGANTLVAPDFTSIYLAFSEPVRPTELLDLKLWKVEETDTSATDSTTLKSVAAVEVVSDNIVKVILKYPTAYDVKELKLTIPAKQFATVAKKASKVIRGLRLKDPTDTTDVTDQDTTIKIVSEKGIDGEAVVTTSSYVSSDGSPIEIAVAASLTSPGYGHGDSIPSLEGDLADKFDAQLAEADDVTISEALDLTVAPLLPMQFVPAKFGTRPAPLWLASFLIYGTIQPPGLIAPTDMVQITQPPYNSGQLTWSDTVVTLAKATSDRADKVVAFTGLNAADVPGNTATLARFNAPDGVVPVVIKASAGLAAGATGLLDSIEDYTSASGSGFTAALTMDLPIVGTLTVSQPGTGYAVGDSIRTKIGSSSHDAAGLVSAVDVNGGITEVTLTDRGSPYGGTISVQVVSAAGTNATVEVAPAYQIGSVTITSAGQDYLSAPRLSLTTGANAIADASLRAVVSSDGFGSITDVIIDDPGLYLVEPSLTVNSGNDVIYVVTATTDRTCSGGGGGGSPFYVGTILGGNVDPTTPKDPEASYYTEVPAATVTSDTYTTQKNEYGYLDADYGDARPYSFPLAYLTPEKKKLVVPRVKAWGMYALPLTYTFGSKLPRLPDGLAYVRLSRPYAVQGASWDANITATVESGQPPTTYEATAAQLVVAGSEMISAITIYTNQFGQAFALSELVQQGSRPGRDLKSFFKIKPLNPLYDDTAQQNPLSIRSATFTAGQADAVKLVLSSPQKGKLLLGATISVEAGFAVWSRPATPQTNPPTIDKTPIQATILTCGAVSDAATVVIAMNRCGQQGFAAGDTVLLTDPKVTLTDEVAGTKTSKAVLEILGGCSGPLPQHYHLNNGGGLAGGGISPQWATT